MFAIVLSSTTISCAVRMTARAIARLRDRVVRDAPGPSSCRLVVMTFLFVDIFGYMGSTRWLLVGSWTVRWVVGSGRTNGGGHHDFVDDALDHLPPGRQPENERAVQDDGWKHRRQDRKSTRLNSSHVAISYAVFCLKKKKRT